MVCPSEAIAWTGNGKRLHETTIKCLDLVDSKGRIRMNKSQFIELVSQTRGLSKQQASHAYEGFKAAKELQEVANHDFR